jgi:hypothetical protein
MRLPLCLRYQFRSTRGRRLVAEISSFDSYLERAIQTGKAGEWGENAKAAISEAHEALRQNHFAEALIAFDRAQREEIPRLEATEIRLRAISLVRQCEQLNDLARNTIKEILRKTDSVTAAELAAATKIRDEDLQNAVFQMQRLSRHLSRLSIITAGILLAVVFLAKCHVLPTSPSTLVGVMCFGALGAAVSMMISIAPLAAGSIPSQLATGTLLLARPLFGASASVALYIFIKMGVLNRPYDNDFAYFGLAFAAGFSDQLLLSAVTKLVKSSGEPAKGQDHRQDA